MVLRGLFALCIAVALIFRPMANADRGAAAVELMNAQMRAVLEAQGLETFPPRTRFEEGSARFAVWFAAEDCVEEAVAIPMFVSLNVPALLSVNDAVGWAHEVHHLDQSGPSLSRLGMFWGASWARVGNALGVAETPSPMHAIIVAWPEGCDAVGALDLRGVWGAGA